MLFLWLVVLQLGLFAVLVLFLRVILSRNITRATTHLHSLNEDYAQKIDEARKRMQEADKYYDETILKAKAEAEKTKVQIIKEAQTTAETLVAQSRKQSEDILAQANRARDLMLQEIEQRIEEGAVARGAELAQAVLPGEVTVEIHARWVDELLKSGLGDLGRLHVPPEISKAEVRSAHPLTAEQRRSLARVLKEKVHRDLEIVDRVEPGLIAGFRVTLGSVVIDGSLEHKIKEAVRHAQSPAG